MIASVKQEPKSGHKAKLREAIQNAQEHLLQSQNPEGYWAGCLEADASVSAGYIPLMYFLGEDAPEERIRGIVNYCKERQGGDGSWGTYWEGPGDINVTVQVYFAMKLARVPSSEPWMQMARSFIRRSGGLTKINTITRIWLAVFGQVDWREVPVIPPEAILLPNWFPLSIYEFSSWSRATIVALMAVIAMRPACAVPSYANIEDIRFEAAEAENGRTSGLLSWNRVFLGLDRVLKLWDRAPLKPLRKTALARVERWILQHQENDGGWGGILLPWVYSLMALKSLGYSSSHPAIAKGVLGLEDFFVNGTEETWLQPATSPVWDTAWSVIALRESGLPADHPALQKAAGWLLSQEIRRGGDWCVKNPGTEPGCWAFEFVNQLYPDLDDTAVVPRALMRVRMDGESEAHKHEAIRRALSWTVRMQGADGGWAAFDRDNTNQILAQVPYADFMTPLDPASADVTAHVIEFLAECGDDSAAISRALPYLETSQEADGAWYGRWGVNYIYGTGLVLDALRTAGEPAQQDWIQLAAGWLADRQNPDGGWGESCGSYDDPLLRGKGKSTASQTAWALLGLLASQAGDEDNRMMRAIRRGVLYLLDRQEPHGYWSEPEYTGTGFPRAFYLRYDLYRLYFPLIALSKYLGTFVELDEEKRRFAATPPGERVLLLSHCLRKSAVCKASYDAWGLQCRHCRPECAINQLSRLAENLGYKGVCVAPGGSLAVNYVERMRPRAIAAVACMKELKEGVQRVGERLSSDGDRPAIVVVPLTKDGCVDTEVDLPEARRILSLGCQRSRLAEEV
jgi:squalene-hopene/tetraprenyl-beta-curcumene cyclase